MYSHGYIYSKMLFRARHYVEARRTIHANAPSRLRVYLKKIKTTKKNTHEFFKVPIKIASIFHDPEIWFYYFVFFFRHSQTQNTSFRALLDTGNEYRQEVGFFRCEGHHDTVSNYGSEQRNIFQTKVSRRST